MKKKRLDDYMSSLCWRKKFLVMRLVYFLMVGFVVLLPTSASAQDKMISLETRSETLSSVLMKIKDQSGVNILYNENVLRDVSCKDMKLEKVTVKEVLNRIFEGTHFGYEVSRGVIVIRERQAKEVIQKSVKVSGQVFDEKGERLPGVTVLIKGTSIGVATDVNGKYSIAVPNAETATLEFSFVGMKTQSVKLIPNKTVYDVTLLIDSQTLDDVVCTGYQTLSKINTTGSFSTLKPETIELRSSIGLDRLLEGAVPGLTVYKNDIRIRGGSSINAGTKPLYIVDGFEVDKLPENMDLVERISILKDAAAAAIWGARASNGVIVIETKKGKKGESRISYS